MSEWVSGVDTPQTVMTTRAPAVLKMPPEKVIWQNNIDILLEGTSLVGSQQWVYFFVCKTWSGPDAAS